MRAGLNTKCLIANLECWYYLSSKLSRRLDKGSFTTYSAGEQCDNQLGPFVEYLMAPVFLLIEIKDEALVLAIRGRRWRG